MKITAIGPDGWRRYFERCPVILLDGCEQQHVVEANDETGKLVRTKLDAHGFALISGDVVETETRWGKVEIVGNRRPQP